MVIERLHSSDYPGDLQHNRIRKAAGSADEALPGLCLHSCAHYGTEVCRRAAPGKAGENLGKRRHFLEPGYHGQLGDSVQPDLAEAAVQAHEAAASGTVGHPCGRDRGTGAERGREACHLEVQDVAVCQRCACSAPDSALRIPAGLQRQAGRELSQGVHRLSCDGWVCGVQPGAERNPLRLRSHARRKWREAMPEGATVKTSKAAVGYRYCNRLFAEERKCALYRPEFRKEYRQNKESPLLEEYFAWLNTLHPEKDSKLEDAVRYSLNQKQQLMAFLDYGEVHISNNLAENAIRPFTLGRKNWLFCDTPKGADASAVVYYLVESAKANGIEPFAYLQHVLVQFPYFGKSQSHEGGSVKSFSQIGLQILM